MTPVTLSNVGTELLDDPAADPAIVVESLRNLARANWWFGGTAAALFGLGQLLRDAARGTTWSLLDIGTGTADLPRAAVRWAAAHGWRLVPIGLERSPVAARLAVTTIPTVIGCAGTPPIREKSVDVVLVSQVVHHLSPTSAIELFRACDRLARRGVVVADLRRNVPAQVGFWFASHLLRFDRATREDGITSIQRGYTRRELAGLLSAAGVPATITGRPLSRLVATWHTDGPRDPHTVG